MRKTFLRAWVVISLPCQASLVANFSGCHELEERMPAGRADILRRSLIKQKAVEVEKLRLEFWGCAERKGRTQTEIESVWNLLFGFQGYAFCRAPSNAYGVEACQAAHFKRYYPAEFLSAVLTNEKGFYSPLALAFGCRVL